MLDGGSRVTTQALQNLSVLNAADVGNSRGVGCCTPEGAALGVWLDPSGAALESFNQGGIIYILARISRVDLFRDPSRAITASQEGVYTCRVTDAISLYVGLYSDEPG